MGFEGRCFDVNGRPRSLSRRQRARARAMGFGMLALFGCGSWLPHAHAQADPAAGSEQSAAVSPAHRLQWNPAWPRFRPIGYALTGVSVLGALAVTFFVDYPDEPRWRGGILFDNAARRALRARSPGLRDAVRIASDVTLYTSVVQAGLIDGLLVPLLDRSPEVATQLTLMNAQAFALDILISTLLFKVVARERPLIADCETDPGSDPLCSSGPYASFPSSHASTAFTAAGLVCVHHAHLPLYGGGWDVAACAEALTLATATAAFRVVGDRHYMTDILAGAAIGFAIGYLYPWLLHYSLNSTDEVSERSSGEPARFSVLPGPTGLSIAGVF